jgi:hypothetical protein
MQALKQAAREGNSARVDALCDAWSVPVGGEGVPDPIVIEGAEGATSSVEVKAEEPVVSESGMESCR